MRTRHLISEAVLEVDFFDQLLTDISLGLSESARKSIRDCREYLDEKINDTAPPVYGINTGFGSLHDHNIPADKLEQLQENLVMSHACGTGKEVPQEIVRIMLFLKIQSLSYGHSGVQVETVERLITLFNEEAWPVIYEFGSLGASGDLAPLAHLALPLLGQGELNWKGKRISGAEFLEKLNLRPLKLKSKEGLALLNGTQFMTAYGIWCLVHARRLRNLANGIGALSLDVFDGRTEPFDARVHKIRPHKGQIKTAAEVQRILTGSELQKQPKKHVQDPYSFRCIPQVHGASADTISFVLETFLTEVNSITDNPNIFYQDDVIISAGNFHGQPLALGMDFLAVALAELGNISERRTYQLISGARGLPNYLTKDAGLNSGMMILQYTAAGIVSRNKQLCTPASVDSIVSSNGQEDHVSMGANAATRTREVVENLYSILAIELLIAVQALDFRRPLKTSPILEEFAGNFRKVVPLLDGDRVMHNDIRTAEHFLKQYTIKK